MVKRKNLTQLSIIIVFSILLGSTQFQFGSSAAATLSLDDRVFSASEDYSSDIEKRIRAGQTTTAELIVDSHPRVWIRGSWDWDADNVGSFAWRIVHGPAMWNSDPANDAEKSEFYYIFEAAQDGIYGGTYYSPRFLYTILAAEVVTRDPEWNLPRDIPSSSQNPDFDPQYSEDEFLAAAREKLIERSGTDLKYEWPYERVVEASVGYDWLVDRKYSDGNTPVLSYEDKLTIQNNIIAQAEYVRSSRSDSDQLFQTSDISHYIYVIAGLALYEPSGEGISPDINAKAKQYLDEFDTYWIGKILPALNEQGGTGGWHAGLCKTDSEFDYRSDDDVLTYAIAPILYAHYTATGQSYEDSVFSTGALKYAIEFQNHMVYPDGEYLAIGSQGGQRYQWIMPMQPTARRRFSSDPEQQALGELAGWFRNEIAPGEYVNAGSHDTFKQLMWEQKFPNGRPPQEIGFSGTRHFAKLGWVAMRTDFTSSDDLAALFMSQRYHWSHLNPYSQNSFTLYRKGALIEGFQNSMFIGGEYQRWMDTFPTITDGVEAYSPGSIYDVGPGILAFESNDTYDYMLGDATNAYDTSKLAKFSRQVVYLKPDIFVIFDRVLTTSSGIEKKWVVDPAATPQDQGDGLITADNGSSMLWIKRLLPTNASVSLSDTEIAVVPSQSGTETTFLHVMQAVDSGAGAGQVSADDATVSQEGDWFHVQVAGRKISFSRNGEFEFDGQPTTLRGDVNLDGIVDQLDVQLSVNVFLAFEHDPGILGRADLNKDGIVNSLDIQEIFLEANK
jgi:hypothetical protein